IGHCQALPAREALCRLRRTALLVEGDALARPAALDVGGPLGQAFDEECEPPWSDQELGRLGFEVAAAELRELGLSLPAGQGGKLLAPDLKEQARHPAPVRARRRAEP